MIHDLFYWSGVLVWSLAGLAGLVAFAEFAIDWYLTRFKLLGLFFTWISQRQKRLDEAK